MSKALSKPLPSSHVFSSRPVRKIEGLLWAERTSSPFGPQKAEGARAEGLRFERKVFRHLQGRWPDAEHNPWIAFEDAFGESVACPDIVVPSQRLIVECKRTYSYRADLQLTWLYAPLCAALWGETPASWALVVALLRWNGGFVPTKFLFDLRQAPKGAVAYWPAGL